MTERTTPALAQRLRWSLSDVGRIMGSNYIRPFVYRADAQHRYSLTPAGWDAVGQKPPIHMEEVA